MARKAAAQQAARRPSRQSPSGIRIEIGAIALTAFAVLTAVALLSDQGAVLHWWRSTLVAVLGWGAAVVPVLLLLAAAAVWYEPLRARLVSPGIGIAVVLVALLGLAHIAAAGAGGTVGGILGGGLAAALSPLGGTIALLAVAIAGIVLAAGRTIAELTRPALDRRPQLPPRTGGTPGDPLGALRARLGRRSEGTPPEHGAASPGDSRAGRASAQPDDSGDGPHEMRINIPEERPRGTVAAHPGAATADAVARTAATPREARSAEAAQQEAHAGSLAGLPSALVAVEGVLHAVADRDWTLPSIKLLQEGTAARWGEEEVRKSARVIEETLAHFSIAAKVVEISVGPVVTRYEIKPAAGVKLSRIEALSDDLALALAARTLRIEAPVPGKSVVGIEVPNLAIGMVSLRDVVETPEFVGAKSKLVVAIGRDVAGGSIVLDLAKLPHLLVAGQTGSGKSVNISAIVCSLLLNSTPDDVRLIIGDLKRVDFAGFNGVPHLIVPVLIEHDKILNALHWVTGEMDRRYRLFARTSARNIAAYNEKHEGPDRIPYIVFVIDELADLMLRAPILVEKNITRIAQLARATGIHLVLGTQRPSVDVITGLIKANIPARIAFATASAVDSRTILDLTGAEKLLGRGDLLVLPPDAAKPVRAQGVLVTDNEIAAITKHWKDQGPLEHHDEVTQGEDRLTRTRDDGGEDMAEDDRYDEAVEIVRRAGQASVSMLQRKMTVGFARAGRLIDVMEQNGVIGPAKGPGKMREVYGAAAARATDEEGS